MSDGPTDSLRERVDAVRAGLLAADRRVRARNRRWLLLVAGAVALALLAGPVALVVSVAVATTSADARADEIARRVAPEVIRQVIADSREQRKANARAVLAAANTDLTERGLPIVADPGPQANAEQILAAASSAQVLTVLPPEVLERLREKTSGGPIMLPSSTARDLVSPDPGDAGGRSDRDPGAGSPSSPTTPGPSGGFGGSGGQPAPQPGPGAAPDPDDPVTPPPTRRRLIPPVVPIPGLPLIGT